MKKSFNLTTQKTLHLILPAAMACLGSISLSHADGVAGQWKAELESPLGQQKHQFVFKVANGKLTATAAAEMGDQKRKVDSIDEKLDGKIRQVREVAKEDVTAKRNLSAAPAADRAGR